MFGGSRSRTRRLHEFSGFSAVEEVLLLVLEAGEELSDAEEQLERSSFVNSKTKRELSGA